MDGWHIFPKCYDDPFLFWNSFFVLLLLFELFVYTIPLKLNRFLVSCYSCFSSELNLSEKREQERERERDFFVNKKRREGKMQAIVIIHKQQQNGSTP